jgi:hypothetical protein
LQLDEILNQRCFLHFITTNMEWRQWGNLFDGVSTVPKAELYVFGHAISSLVNHVVFFNLFCLLASQVSDLSSLTQVVLTHYLQARLLSCISAIKYTVGFCQIMSFICNISLHCSAFIPFCVIGAVIVYCYPSSLLHLHLLCWILGELFSFKV